MSTRTSPDAVGAEQARRFAVYAVADSTGACLTQLRPGRFTDLAAGRLGISARPRMRRVSWLATDIVAALGCRQDVAGAGRPGDTDTLTTAAWLQTHRIRHLYVQFAWDSSHPALAAAAGFAQLAGVTLWLVGDSPYTEQHAHVLAEFGVQEWAGQEFLDHWNHLLDTEDKPAREERATSDQDAGGGWPARLPDDDFTTFRAACRDRLTTAQFTLVNARFRAAHHDATVGLVPLLSKPTENQAEDEDESDPPVARFEKSVAGWLAEHWETAACVAEFQVIVRAAQVAAFGAGYLLQVNLDQLIGTATTTPRRAQRSPETWALLRAYPQPYRAATCALTAAGMGLASITDLSVQDYDAVRGVVVDKEGTRFVVEPAARIFVEAQQTVRRLEGATEQDLLFVNPNDGRRFQPRALAATVRLARRELGAAVALAAPDRLNPDPTRWYRRWGVSIQELT